MVTIVPSRFAGLKIEDDDEDEWQKPKHTHKKNDNKNKQQTPANQNGKQPTKNKKPNQSKKKKAKGENEEQWKTWQERDNQLVENSYEKDLEHALLLSKLEFEEKKLESQKCEKSQEKKTKGGKSKKSQPMNLQQFNTMLEEKDQVVSKPVAEVPKKTNFFENINEEAKNIMLKEQMQIIGQTQKNKMPTESVQKTQVLEDTSSEPLSELEQLRQENAKLKQELDQLKEKSKKVSAILKNAEFKEKVELVLEIQNLKKAQQEMSNEMSKLYIELEQEKSRASHAIQSSHSNNSDSKAFRSSMRKSVRFDEQSFHENSN
uniref:CSON012008 protein n=1 Tax=Culicoides sonorensis TaxID=179676 RepID=A0A336LMC9_CULSO